MDINTDNLNKTVLKSIGVLLAVFLGLLVIQKASEVYKSFATNTKPANTISMSAEGKTTAKPDLAIVNVGVFTEAKTAKAASDANNTNINQVTEAVKKLGVKSDDIQTSNFSVYPNYNYSSGKNEISGYQANQTLTIKIHGIDKSADVLNQVLDASVAAGSNQIQGVNFTFNDPDNLKQQARKLAIDKAKQKAQELADQAGLRLGKIVSISEDNYGYPVPMMYATDKASGMGGGPVSSPEVQTGTQDVTASITVVFEIK